MDGGTDLQAVCERNIMDGDLWGNDWYWSDEELDIIGIVEYRLYEHDCESIRNDYDLRGGENVVRGRNRW